MSTKENIWVCKVGGISNLPYGADAPMRDAVGKAFTELTGCDYQFCFSGWGGELTEPERAVVEERLPVNFKEYMASNKLTNEELRAAVCNLRQALAECIADFKYEGSDGWMEGQMHSVDYKVAVMMLEKTAKYDTE